MIKVQCDHCGDRIERCWCDAVQGEHWVDVQAAANGPGQLCQPSPRYCATSRVGGKSNVAHTPSRAAVEE